MAMPSDLDATPAPDATASRLPAVRLEVRTGANRPTLYEVGDAGFLIGSVPGCDLRLPGANLPPVLCLISLNAAGAGVRKLAPVQPMTVNGRAVASASLNSGDKLTLGPVEIIVRIAPAALTAAQAPLPDAECVERFRQLELREAQLKLDASQVEADCRRQTQKLEEARLRLRRQEQDFALARGNLEAREQAWRDGQQELERQRALLASGGEKATKNAEEVLGWRHELEQLKLQLHERFRQKREKITKMGQAVRRAGLRVQRKKHENEAESVLLKAARQDLTRRQSELDATREQFERERQVVAEQHRITATRQENARNEMAARRADVEKREQKLIDEYAALDKGQKQHQADLVRLDRLQAVMEQRQKQVQQRALEVDRRSEQLERDTRELEAQANQLDEMRETFTCENETFAVRNTELEETRTRLDQRAAALETQQAMLSTLRTRVERMRDELRRQEQALSEQRVLQEAAEQDVRRRAEETKQLRLELANEKESSEQERRRFQERSETLDRAVAQVRQAQESHAAAEAQLHLRQEEVDASAVQQAEQAGMLLARGKQVEELHARAAGDRLSLREREAALARAEESLGALQEQLRRRGDELAERERNLAEQRQRVEEQTTLLDARIREWEAQKKLGSENLDAMRLELGSRAAALDEKTILLTAREQKLTSERNRLDEEFHALQGQQQAAQAERVAFALEKQTASEAAARRQAELDAARAEALEVSRQLPDLEARSEAAIERLLRGREQLREHLAELHTFTRQGREDLEEARKQLHDEAERVRQKELQLHGVRDEHRLAVAAFRQQLVEWQGNLTEMRQSLLRGESRLDRRSAEVEERAQQVAVVRQELAHQAEQLHEAEREVEEKRGEMTRHLSEMREWYRKKMRELSGIDSETLEDDGRGPSALGRATIPSPQEILALNDRGILALTGEVDPGDRQLGDLLRSLELIDADTLIALLMEARRQRRSLRQLLLAGNYLTLYQMALIEAGNLDGLVLGPVRVIDRLSATPREAVYRVYDPRTNREALLRHLAEAEMEDAVRPDEFRQRFAAAAGLQHAHLAATYEVLDLGGRPAVLQEWLNGLPSSDWPTLAAAPGVWYRLLSQAALALQTAHAAGLVHGHLQAHSFILTGDGVLKLTGLGEPRWLTDKAATIAEEPTVSADLTALGRVAAGWADSTPNRKGGRTKSLPEVLQAIVRRLESDQSGERFDSTAALLEALDLAGAEVPTNATAWERFLKQVREQSDDVALRRTA